MLIGEGSSPTYELLSNQKQSSRRYSRGGPVPATETGNQDQEDAQGMANVDNGLVSPEKPGEQPAGPGRTRAGKPAGPAFKPMHHEDTDPQEFAAMLGIYDDSFRNMAEG